MKKIKLAFDALYQALTPEQRQKADQTHPHALMRLRAFALATDSELRRAVNWQLASLAEGYLAAHQSSSWSASSPAGEPDQSRQAQPPPRAARPP
jgi:hypothetical protein